MRMVKGAALSLALVLAASNATAGVYTDDMSKCLVKSTTDEDKVHLVQWLFTEMARNPALKDIAFSTPERRVQFEKEGAILFQRLMLVDCRKETVEAIKYEGSAAIQKSFEVLGNVAGQGLMTDPSVMAGLQAMASYFDKDRWAALSKETGLK